MSLTFFEEQLHDVDVELHRFRQRDAVWRGAGRRLSQAKRSSVAYRHDLGNRGVAIEHGNRFAATHRAQVFTEPGFQLGDTDLFHSHIMTRNGHVCK